MLHLTNLDVEVSKKSVIICLENGLSSNRYQAKNIAIVIDDYTFSGL